MNRFISFLLSTILFELMLGGGGRLTALGPVSLRMILFALAIITVGIQLLRKQKLPTDYWFISILFGIILIIGTVRGITIGASRALWWEDLKPLLYFFILPFFGLSIRHRSVVAQTATIIKRSGIILSVLFILTLILIHTSILPFIDFSNAVIGAGEFFFRGELTFFYKGFIYVCIAFLFVHFDTQQYRFPILILLAAGIILSVTRGFLLALTLTYSCYYFLKSSFVKSAFLITLSFLAVVVGQVAISESSKVIDQLKSPQERSLQKGTALSPTLLGDRSYSDEGRFQQIKEVAEQVSLSSILIGHGFGNGVPSRPIHMEISYLEIFHKQGLIGLTFWAYLIWLLYQKYRLASQGGLRDAFFFGSLFIYFQSLTNQYVNNPIGLAMILLSLVSLDQLKENQE
jgi:hypothetical protein